MNDKFIAAGVNAKRLLEGTRALFSTSATAYAELMQNARRAGASKINITVAKAGDGTNVLFEDDGVGIEDFYALISLAESGWDEAIVKAEQPFGIGFCSVAFAAKCIVVESRRQRIEFTQDDIILQRKIALKPSKVKVGTRIHLMGTTLSKRSIEEALERFAQGFPISIWMNQQAVERQHALGQADLVELDNAIGKIILPKTCWNLNYNLYYQGLPIRGLTQSYKYHHRQNLTIHLNSGNFMVRMPDREALINPDVAEKRIHAGLIEALHGYFKGLKQTMTSEAFVTTYWDILLSDKGLASLLDDVPCIAGSAMWRFDDLPFIETDFHSNDRVYEKDIITMAQIQSGERVLVNEDPSELMEDSTVAHQYSVIATWMWLKQWWFLRDIERLSKNHWLHAWVKDVHKLQANIKGKTLQKSHGQSFWMEIHVLEKLDIEVDGVSVECNYPLISRARKRSVVLAPKRFAMDQHFIENALCQANTYNDGYDNFDEVELSNDGFNVSNVILELMGQAPNITLQNILRQSPLQQFPSLVGKSFKVTVAEQGDVQVELV